MGEQLNAITSVSLGNIKSVIGPLDKGFGRKHIYGVGDTKTGRQPDGVALEGELYVFYLSSVVLGKIDGFGGISICQDHGKFLPAVSGGKVGIATLAENDLGHLLKGLIASLVTVGVVDKLELVYVDHHQ